MNIKIIQDDKQKMIITREILESLQNGLKYRKAEKTILKTAWEKSLLVPIRITSQLDFCI